MPGEAPRLLPTLANFNRPVQCFGSERRNVTQLIVSAEGSSQLKE